MKFSKGPFLLLIALVGTLSAGAVSAACNTYICESARITRLVTTASGNTFVLLDANMSALSCTLDSSTYITLLSSSARFKEIFATLLAHYMAERPISIRIDTGSTGCTVNYVYGE